jgi:hypothetical protein
VPTTRVLFLADTVANMNRNVILESYFTQEQIDAAIARAPDWVDDPDSPYDPNDEAAVEAYWSKAKITLPGQHPFQKTPNKTGS